MAKAKQRVAKGKSRMVKEFEGGEAKLRVVKAKLSGEGIRG